MNYQEERFRVYTNANEDLKDKVFGFWCRNNAVVVWTYDEETYNAFEQHRENLLEVIKDFCGKNAELEIKLAKQSSKEKELPLDIPCECSETIAVTKEVKEKLNKLCAGGLFTFNDAIAKMLKRAGF